jgi:2-polyprenyl-3-methyl-5-hydroxy-6-metoxy-1,4-benzoquinol methylase
MSESEWDQYAEDWDDNHEVRLYAQKAFDSLEQRVVPLITNLSECKVLDFGCGTGLLTQKLAPLCQRIVAVDTSEKMLGVLSDKVKSSDVDNVTTLKIEVSPASIAVNPDLLGDFDLVLASSVCSFLPDYELTLTSLASIMKPGAYFVQWDWATEMPAERIKSAFKGAGLSPHAIEAAFAMEAEHQPALVNIGMGTRQA